MKSPRVQRVADAIRAEIGRILISEVRDPGLRLASVSRVELSRDLSHATIYVSSLADEGANHGETLEALQRARGFIRSTLASRISFRRVPELHFEIDHGAEHSRRITDLLEDLDLRSDDAEDVERGGEQDHDESGATTARSTAPPLSGEGDS